MSPGNLFIADQGNHRIREVNATTGLITTVAGTGTGGYSGDGGPAIAAQLNSPVGVAVDTLGSLLIVDAGNNCLRAVHLATGVITTAASGLASPQGVAVDVAGGVYVADSDHHQIARFDRGAWVTVQAVEHPFHNAAIPTDVDGSGQTTPTDVLLVISYINANSSGVLPSVRPPGGPQVDVNGDGQVTPLDVLLAISFINAHGIAAGESAAGVTPRPSSLATDAVLGREGALADAVTPPVSDPQSQ